MQFQKVNIAIYLSRFLNLDNSAHFCSMANQSWLIFQYICELYICVKVFVLPYHNLLGINLYTACQIVLAFRFQYFKTILSATMIKSSYIKVDWWISLQKSKSWIYALQCCNKFILHLACLRSHFILNIFKFSGKFCPFLLTYSSFSKLTIILIRFLEKMSYANLKK